MQTNIPRPEYPRPQFVLSEWLNLNGEWQFEIGPGDSIQKRSQTTILGVMEIV
jgi:hypothetical protein